MQITFLDTSAKVDFELVRTGEDSSLKLRRERRGVEERKKKTRKDLYGTRRIVKYLLGEKICDYTRDLIQDDVARK